VRNCPRNICRPIISDQTRKTRDAQLVGEVNEATVLVNDIPAKALLDTGSCVSVMTRSFYEDHLSHLEIEPVTSMINIECADGSKLPYEGCTEVDLKIDNGLPQSGSHPCLMLITKDKAYSQTTPLLLGTNILRTLLDECKSNFGCQYIQRA